MVLPVEESCWLLLTCSTFSTLPALVVIFKWMGILFWACCFFFENSARYLSVALPSKVASGIDDFVIYIFIGYFEASCCCCCYRALRCSCWIFFSPSIFLWSSISFSFLSFSSRSLAVFYFSISNCFFNSIFSICCFSNLIWSLASSFCLFSWAADTISFSADFETSLS
jgi:hypothetical protein